MDRGAAVSRSWGKGRDMDKNQKMLMRMIAEAMESALFDDKCTSIEVESEDEDGKEITIVIRVERKE